jgi:hypothetical protein
MVTESIALTPAVAKVNPFPDIKHFEEQPRPEMMNETKTIAQYRETRKVKTHQH